MARRTDGTRSGTTKAKPGIGTARVPARRTRAGELVRVDGGDAADAVFRQDDVTLVVGRPYRMGDRDVVVDAAYYVGGGEAPASARLGGADKVAWRDAASGYECIIMRDEGGYLRGFVGVDPGHPLYGFVHDAVPSELGIEVHGGLTYSAVCQDGPSPQPRLIYEVRRICHVPVGYVPVVNATDHRPAHDRAWWFGFDCNHVYDVVPGDRLNRERFLAREIGAEFRDEGYVYDQVVDLAAQLRAIEDGFPKPPRTGASPPPLGLDPRKAG